MQVAVGCTLPLDEVSALCWSAAEAALLAVGDDCWRLGRARIDGGGLVADAVQPVAGGSGKRGSEFEGIAADASGRCFVLREGPATILVLADGAVERTVPLRVDPEFPRLGREWNDPDAENARGEGLVLLRGGHVLVAKQRRSTWLIEFGPADDAARGVTPDSPLRDDEAFALPAGGAELRALAAWRVDQPDVKSLNDLAVGPDGLVHAVSATSRSLARLGHDLVPGSAAAVLTALELPAALYAADDDKVEGLAHVPELGWVVALDHDREGENVRRLLDVTFPPD